MSLPPPSLPPVLARVRQGDPVALSALVAELYDELRLIAHGQRRRLRASDTVHTTALVHEAYVKLARRGEPLELVDRGHFFRVAARVMHDVLVDYARNRRAAKRGGGRTQASATGLAPPRYAVEEEALDIDTVLSVHEALGRLKTFDEESARVVELRYFGGLSNAQVGEALSLSSATVKRRWTCARAWLRGQLEEGPAFAELP